jgi:hypothetical protein
MDEQHFDSHKIVGLTERWWGVRLSACGALPPGCNTAAESRRESALVDEKISGCHFWLLTALFQIMKDKGQGSQAGACMSPVEDTGKASALAIQTKL